MSTRPFTAAALGGGAMFQNPAIVERIGEQFAVITDLSALLVGGWSFGGNEQISVTREMPLRRVELARMDGRLMWQVPGGAGTGEGVFPIKDGE